MLRFEIPERLPKAPGMYDRSVPLEETLGLVPSLRERYGITRIADVTYLDRSGIPVVNAVVPDSPDAISLYNGKGPTRENALAGAVMEAVERQVAAQPHIELVYRIPSLVEDGINGDQYGLLPEWRDRPIPFVRGYDLIQEQPAHVPLALVQCPWKGPVMFPAASTNGLAAGNNYTEAVYHALFELVERHVWSVSHARGHLVPRMIVENFTGVKNDSLAALMTDDPVGYCIELPTKYAAIDHLLERLESASIGVTLRALVEPHLPVTMVACIYDLPCGSASVYAGLGCSWSPYYAALRAITEAVQSRLTDLQAAREDILRPQDPAGIFVGHLRRRSAAFPKGRWYFDAPAPRVSLEWLDDRSSQDLGDDLRLLIEALKMAGADSAVIVDIAAADSPVAVVRAVVPHLESTVIDRRIGETVQNILKPHSLIVNGRTP